MSPELQAMMQKVRHNAEMPFTYYELNVATKDHRHLFATHKRSCGSLMEAMTLLDLMLTKFPESEGYEVTLTGMVEYGRSIYAPK